MRVLRVDLEYDGAGFSGWAAQPGRRTVEGELRRALGVLLGEPLDIAVAGRTDAGVHASGQVASARTASPMAPERVLRGLGGLLPPDLSARAVSEAQPGFDARRDAVGRRYEYRVLVGARSALRRGRVLHHPGPLDVAALRAAAAHAVGQHDFRAWSVRGDEVVFGVEADAFLRHMVRILAGTMLLVGRGAWTPERFARLLEGAPRGAAGATAPAHPLTLVGVRYAPAPG
jgi:tRNA pseudouridine38-40 synthase